MNLAEVEARLDFIMEELRRKKKELIDEYFKLNKEVEIGDIVVADYGHAIRVTKLDIDVSCGATPECYYHGSGLSEDECVAIGIDPIGIREEGFVIYQQDVKKIIKPQQRNEK